MVIGVFERLTRNFGSSSARFIYVESGLASENLLLQVVALGLSSTHVGGFNVTKAEQFLGLQPSEEPIALLPVGREA